MQAPSFSREQNLYMKEIHRKQKKKKKKKKKSFFFTGGYFKTALGFHTLQRYKLFLSVTNLLWRERQRFMMMFGAMQHNHLISLSSNQITTSSNNNNNNINYLIQQVSYNSKKFTTTKIKYATLRRPFSSKPQFRFFCQSKVIHSSTPSALLY